MIRKFTLVLVVVSLLVAPTVLAENGANKETYGEVFAVSQNSTSGDIMYVSVYQDPYWGSDVYVSLDFGFYCYTPYMGTPVYSLNINHPAKFATFEIDTSSLECYSDNGAVPQMISGECTFNGEFSEQEISKAQGKYSYGYSYNTHTIIEREGADCTITAGGVLYDQSLSGLLANTQVVEKEN